jgi:hypothetical protein
MVIGKKGQVVLTATHQTPHPINCIVVTRDMRDAVDFMKNLYLDMGRS